MTALANLCEFIVDCEHKTAPTQELGFPSIRTPNIGRGFFILDNVNRVSEATYEEWTERAIPLPGDLILAREAPVGNVAVIPEGERFCLGQRTVLIRPDPCKVVSDYLCYLLLTPSMQGLLAGKSGGATVHHLNMRDIRSLPIPALPDLTAQRRVSGVIKAYDDLIATNQRRIQLLEDAARRLYREWFVQLRFPGHESVPARDGVPEGWVVVTLGDLAGINARSIGSKEQPNSLLYVDISSVQTGTIGQITPFLFAEAPGRARRLVRHGDIIWSCVRPNRRSYALIWEPDEDLVVSTGFAVISATDAPFSYLYCAATTDDFVGYLEQNATGATYPAVTAKVFEAAPVLQPAPNVMKEFDDCVLPMLQQMETLKAQNLELAKARDLLLPKLMSGQLDVSRVTLPAPSDEP